MMTNAQIGALRQQKARTIKNGQLSSFIFNSYWLLASLFPLSSQPTPDDHPNLVEVVVTE